MLSLVFYYSPCSILMVVTMHAGPTRECGRCRWWCGTTWRRAAAPWRTRATTPALLRWPAGQFIGENESSNALSLAGRLLHDHEELPEALQHQQSTFWSLLPSCLVSSIIFYHSFPLLPLLDQKKQCMKQIVWIWRILNYQKESSQLPACSQEAVNTMRV